MIISDLGHLAWHHKPAFVIKQKTIELLVNPEGGFVAKRISFYLLSPIISLFLFFLGCTDPIPKSLERYNSKEIIIGKYDYKGDQPVVGKDGVSWWKLDSSQIVLDEQKRIYVLDVYRSKILQYSPDGTLVQELSLKNTAVPYSNPDIDDSGPDSSLKVNRDGSYFYVITDEFKWTVFNNSGEPIRQKEIIPTTISMNRLCDDKVITNYEIMDAQFNVLSKLTYKLRVQNDYPVSADALFNFSNSTRRPSLSKMNSSRKLYWEKKVDRDCIIMSILGLDSSGNIYLLTDQPVGIVKLDNNGSFVARLELPKEASDYVKHGTVRGSYQVLCDGSIYYIPPMLYKHDEGFQSFIAKGTKSIYKLERVQ